MENSQYGSVKASHLIFRLLSLVVALNYFAFRCELFSDEDAENHPVHDPGSTFSTPSLNWETFDKDNAPKAFVVNATAPIHLFGPAPVPPPQLLYIHPPFRLIQGMSPPGLSDQA
jgi:hypothetical protein